MRTHTHTGRPVSATRRLEMRMDRFGALEALAYAPLPLARVPDAEPAMDEKRANAILESGDDLRAAFEAESGPLRPAPRRRRTMP